MGHAGEDGAFNMHRCGAKALRACFKNVTAVTDVEVLKMASNGKR
jgi:hypothetical protein